MYASVNSRKQTFTCNDMYAQYSVYARRNKHTMYARMYAEYVYTHKSTDVRDMLVRIDTHYTRLNHHPHTLLSRGRLGWYLGASGGVWGVSCGHPGVVLGRFGCILEHLGVGGSGGVLGTLGRVLDEI